MKLSTIWFCPALIFVLILTGCPGSSGDDDNSDGRLPRDDDDSADDDSSDDDDDVAPECETDADCDDGAYCNGIERCADSICTQGSTPCGDDGVFCNGSEICNEVLDACDHSGSPCADNGLFCNGVEFCDENAAQCLSVGNPCSDDGVFCNGTEICDEVVGACDHTGDPCSDDGDFCNGTEFCDENTDDCDHTGDPCASSLRLCDSTVDACYWLEEQPFRIDDGWSDMSWEGLKGGCLAVQGFELPSLPVSLKEVTLFAHQYGYENEAKLVVYYNDVAGLAPADPPIYISPPFIPDVYSWITFDLRALPEFAQPFDSGELFIGLEWETDVEYLEPWGYDGPNFSFDGDSVIRDKAWVYTLYSWETLNDNDYPGAFLVRPTFLVPVYGDDDDDDDDDTVDLLDEDWEGYTPGDLPSSPWDPRGENLPEADILIEDTGSDNVLTLLGTYGLETRIFWDNSAPFIDDRELVVELDASLVSGAAHFRLTGETTECYAEFLIQGDAIRTRGYFYSYLDCADYTQGSWVTLKMVIDPIDRTFDLFVDGQPSNCMNMDWSVYGTCTGELSRLKIGNEYTVNTDVSVDNVHIYYP